MKYNILRFEICIIIYFTVKKIIIRQPPDISRSVGSGTMHRPGVVGYRVNIRLF